MKKFKIKGFTVTVFEGYYGKQMFINNPSGEEVWAHKSTGDAFEQAKRIINQN